jgi:hypothetical protein
VENEGSVLDIERASGIIIVALQRRVSDDGGSPAENGSRE